MRILFVLSVSICIAAFTAAVASPTVAKPRAVTFAPAADGYIDASKRSAKLGHANVLLASSSPLRRTYLRFDLRKLNGTVTGAKLRVYSRTGSRGRVVVSAVDDAFWSETSLDVATAPRIGPSIATLRRLRRGWTTLDLGAFARGKYQLGLTLGARALVRLASREAGRFGPRLVVDFKPVAPATMVAAGDVAGCDTTGDEATAALVDSLPGTVAVLGDLVYETGSAAEFTNCYGPSWGRFKNRTRPAAGNHEYVSPGAVPYFDYFGASAGARGQGWYSYDVGAWHAVVLNSNCDAVGGCGPGSPQEQWLRSDLASSRRFCTVAYWHHPRFSSGQIGSDPMTSAFWADLYAAKADLVLVGHDHDYERFAPQRPSGVSAPNDGIREFVVGTGGRSRFPLRTPIANSEVRDDTTFGVLKLTLRAASYGFQFVPVAGSTFDDSGSGVCH